MSEKVKDWNPNIYPHLVKTMDGHSIAIGITWKAQQYVDRGVKIDSTTSHDTAYYARRPQQSSRINRRTEPKQPPRSNNQPTHSQKSSSSKHGRDYYKMRRIHNCNTEPAIWRNYTGSVACFNRRNCPYRHPPAQAHVAATDEGTPNTDIEEQDFRYEQDEMWWLVLCSSTLAITYSTFRNSPCTDHHTLRPPLPSKASHFLV